jgi:hypothetical protein
MVKTDTDVDTWEQLRRRIHYVVYHYIKDGEYCKFEIPMPEYKGYEDLLALVKKKTGYEQLALASDGLPF